MTDRGQTAAFEQHCRRIFVSGALRNGGLHPPRMVVTAARQFGVPRELLAAIRSIELDRRPATTRLLEGSILRINALLWLLFGVPLLNLSLGPFQVRLHRAAELAGLQVTAEGRFVRLPRKRRTERRLAKQLLFSLTQAETNTQFAARYVRALFEEFCETRRTRGPGVWCSDGFIRFLSHRYNGEEPGTFGVVAYADVLRGVIEAQSPST